MLARTSRMGRINPEGAPFKSALSEKEYCVLAMQIGKLLNPFQFKQRFNNKLKLNYTLI